MFKFKKITNGDVGVKAALAASVATISYFFCTFVYLAVFSDSKPGLIAGTIFLIIGMLTVSIVISFPLYFIKFQIPSLGYVSIIANIVITVYITRLAYLWVFDTEPVQGVVVRVCEEPLPEFTLGANSNPSEADVKDLCGCIWKVLSQKDKQTSQILKEKGDDQISYLDRELFIISFGDAVEGCGGKEL